MYLIIRYTGETGETLGIFCLLWALVTGGLKHQKLVSVQFA